MRMSREEKERSRTRIVDSAARLVRERGVEGTGVADVMADAGLTHGGFYRHFESKDALLGTAIDEAFAQILSRLDRGGDDQSPAVAAAEFTAHYLSDGHVRHPGKGCPVAAIGADVGRASAPLKDAFGDGVRRILDALAAGQAGTPRQRRGAAARALATMAGAVMIARACDKATAAEVMGAAREALIARPRRKQHTTS
jgi:TetR/AcrR family transcriptional repressor of nem operon